MRRWLLAVAPWFGALAAFAQADEGLPRVRALLATDPRGAAELIETLRAEPAAAESRFEWAFYAGAASQLAAEAAPASERAAWLEKAEAAYAQAAELRPTSSALAYNRAEVLAQLGRAAEASVGFERALVLAREQRDPKLGFYRLGFAEQLAERDPERALREVESLLAEAPGDVRAEALRERLYLARAPEKALALGARALAAGDLAAAERTALALLVGPAADPSARRDAQRLLAAAWARSGSLLEAARSDAAKSALRGASDTEFGRCAQELLSSFASVPESFPCWAADRAKSQSLGRPGRDVLRELLMAQASEWVRAPGVDSERARTLLSAAIPLGAEGPDPEAFLALANLLANTRQRDALLSLMKRYEGPLFTEKSAAIARGDHALEFRMHIALGLSYAELGVWERDRESESQFQNAFFQLEAAQRAAQRFNARPGLAPEDRLASPPAAVERLARAYAERGNAAEALRVRLEGAEALRAAGRRADARYLLREVDRTRLDASSRTRLDRVLQDG